MSDFIFGKIPENENKVQNESLINSFRCLSKDAKDLYLPKEIPVLYDIPEPLEFYRNWVAPNIPFQIKGGIKKWPALKKWNKRYFSETFREKKVSVAVTPNGYADAITESNIDGKLTKCFTLPEQRTMFFCDFLNKLSGEKNFIDSSVKDSQGIFYIQKQNSNMTEEFTELLPDIDENLSWASEAFNSKPAAINLWIGDERAVTSLHKDPFENIYCVVSGYKDFILIPPTDRPWLPYRSVPVCQYKEVSPGKFETMLHTSNKWMATDYSEECFDFTQRESESNVVPWIDIDPLQPDYNKYPSFSNVTQLKVRIESGDVLYLPSLWFHHVRQSHECIAVNYWYDMNFDIKYSYFQLLERSAPDPGSFMSDISVLSLQKLSSLELVNCWKRNFQTSVSSPNIHASPLDSSYHKLSKTFPIFILKSFKTNLNT